MVKPWRIRSSSSFADRLYKDLSVHTLAPITYYADKKDDSLVSFDNAVVKTKWDIDEVKYDASLGASMATKNSHFKLTDNNAYGGVGYSWQLSSHSVNLIIINIFSCHLLFSIFLSTSLPI